MKLSSRMYTFLTWFCLIALPGLAVFYGVMADTWNLPYGEQIVTTLNALGTLLGVLIGVSTVNFNKENVIYTEPRNEDVE